MVMLTQESIQAARQWCHDNAMACIAEVESGDVRVNDPDSYFVSQRKHAQAALDGEFDHTWSFRQRAHFIQNGYCPALLP